MCSNVCVGGRLKIYHFKGHLDLTRVKVFNMSLEDVEKKMHLIEYGPKKGIFLLDGSSWPSINYKCSNVKVFSRSQARFELTGGNTGVTCEICIGGAEMVKIIARLDGNVALLLIKC